MKRLFAQKKGANPLLVSFITVIALFIIVGQIVDLAQRECSKDGECGSDSYCGSDHQCHKFPTINKNNYVPAALVLGVCLIIAAYILRAKKTTPGQ